MPNRVDTKTNTGWHVVTSYVGDVTKVDVYHLETGIHARGNARRYHSDTYDQRVGRRIAYYRALSRAGQKIVTKTIKGLANGS